LPGPPGPPKLTGVPTLLRIKGYRVMVFVFEPNEPSHVHVQKDGCEAKFWLDPIDLEWQRGYNQSQLNEIADILLQHQARLIQAYEGIHSKK
jgi:hypothetical protein